MTNIFIVTWCWLSNKFDCALVYDLIRFVALSGETDQWIVIHAHWEVSIKDGKKEDDYDMYGEIKLELLGPARAKLYIESLEKGRPTDFLHWNFLINLQIIIFWVDLLKFI